MPRSSRSSGSRPSARSSAPSSSGGSGSRGAHTMAHPQQGGYQQSHAQPAHTPAPAAASGGGGLFSNMASTAAGVAVGSTVGHGLSNMLFGGGSQAAPAPEQPYNVQAAGAQEFAQEQSRMGASCEAQSKDFLRCLEATNNNMDSCSFYLEQLKQCQAAAKPY
ncbi:unnamed protein product [Sympodiomycopsis kandeliae]